MKTKELIKLLQEQDPSGECHVRIGNGPVWFVEEKEGYWDGPYSYLEKGEDKKPIWVQSSEGHKVDIHIIEFFDFAEIFDGNWDEILKHIRFEYDNYVRKDEEINKFIAFAKKECDEYNEIMAKIKTQDKK